MNKKTQAFSLIEVLIVVAIIGIMAAYGIPGMKAFQINAGLSTNTNDLVSSLQFARSAAIRLQGRVVICSSKSSQSASPSCDGAKWHEGWIVFHDADESDTYIHGSNDVLLKVQSEVVMPGMTITPKPLGPTPTNISTYVKFGPPAGEPSTYAGDNQSGVFQICTSQDLTATRGVVVHFSGRVSSTRDNLDPCT